jgi:glycosyltransferase involved in cell wall biosynthesis
MTNSSTRILMLTPDRQIDRRILLQADSLEAAGWDVTILAMPLDNKAEEDPRVVRIGSVISSARRENAVLDIYRWVRSHLPMNGFLMRGMKRLAWRFLVDQESFYTKLFFSSASHYKPGVIVAHDLPMLPVSTKLAKACGAKLVYDSHELYSEQEFSAREKRRWSEIETKYIGLCDVVITVNQSIADELMKRYGVTDVKVIHNAERAVNAPKKTRLLHTLFGLPANRKILLLQGGLSAGRNLENLVDAMQYVQNEVIILVILGDGLLLKKLKQKVQAKNLVSRVYFHPSVAQKDLLAFTAAADAGIIPYQATCLNNYYCTPNKLFEFIAVGLPILGSDLPEIRNMIDGQQIGKTGEMRISTEIAWLIDDFFADEKRLALWRGNTLAARQTVCWENEGEKLVKIYEVLR